MPLCNCTFSNTTARTTQQHQDQNDDHGIFQDNEAGTSTGRGMLSGTGLSSDSEDADASEVRHRGRKLSMPLDHRKAACFPRGC